MITILLSGVGGAPSVNIINHLKSRGYCIIGIDNNLNAVGKYFCDHFIQVPLVSEVKAYINCIQQIDFDIFFPWLDEEHLLFATYPINKQLLQKIVTSSPKSILTVTNKIATYNFAQKFGIRTATPRTNIPAFVRKKFSRGSKHAYIEFDQNRLDKLDPTEYLIQDVIEGQEYTVDIIVTPNIFFAVPRKRLLTSNVSLIGQIDMNSELIQLSRSIAEKLDLFGPINMQFIRSSTDQKLYLIEINPRLAGTSILSIEAGLDMFKPTIDAMSNNKCFYDFKIKDGLKMTRYWCEVFE